MPPKLGQVRRGVAPASTEMLVSRKKGDAVVLPLPLFWDSAPWDTWSPVVAQCVFSAMQSRGVLVSALQSELGQYPQSNSDETAESESEAETTETQAGLDSERGLPRMLPYRNERYGLDPSDFDHSLVVDVHLSPPRDVSGRFAYSATRLGRWEGTPEDQPLSGGGWIPAMTLPPDLPDRHHLAAKLNQIRTLAPHAVIIVSITPEWLEEYLEDLLMAKPDALFLRLGQIRMNGMDLACFAQRILRRINEISHVPVWLTPPRSLHHQSLSVSDSVKLMALGISAIAVDCWLDEIIEEFDEIATPSSYSLNPEQQVLAEVEAILQRDFDPQLETFVGLYSTLVHDRPADLLGSFDPDVAKLLGLPCLGRF